MTLTDERLDDDAAPELLRDLLGQADRAVLPLAAQRVGQLEAGQGQVTPRGVLGGLELGGDGVGGSVDALGDLAGDGSTTADVFGGNNGLNQAIYDPLGIVEVVYSGFRNHYDIVVTPSGEVRNSLKRDLPSTRSRTTRSVHLSPTTSSVHASGQSERAWRLEHVVAALSFAIQTPRHQDERARMRLVGERVHA